MSFPKILAVGGAHIDRRGRITGAYVPGASNPGVMAEDVGGGAFNALRNAIRRGARGSLMSVRGGDAAGETVSRAIVRAGIADLSAIFLDRTTPSYTALLDREGDVIAALADMALYETAFAKQLRRASFRAAAADADALLCDANLPADALARLAAGKPLFAIAISPAKVLRLSETLETLSCLFMNFREAACLGGLSDDASVDEIVARLRSMGLSSAVISHGGAPTVAFDRSNIFSMMPPPPRKIADVTGAGDALAGVTTVALLRGLPLGEALREGMAAAMLAVESQASVPEFSAGAFTAALALVPKAEALHQGGRIGETNDA
ncbi:carbohydrate kinase family protein [Mesorhizobium sp. AaZ16]|uniref:carbohydrate kinase family protein n=1 Tax=Mesorhizobium sp. AaZ16 TaxID=3402289 RepID=UPI00374E4C31